MPNPLARVLADPRRKEALIHKIVAASLNASSSKIQSKHIPRRIIIRYLNNFAFEIGCALPSPEIIRNLLKLLKGPVDEYSEQDNNTIEEEKFHILIEICLKLYADKQASSGGVFERVGVAIKQCLYQDVFDQEQ